MTRNLGRLVLAFAFSSLCIISFCRYVDARPLPTIGSSDSRIQALSTASSNFEIKIVDGNFQVRQRGTQEWKKASELTEPVVISQSDEAHKIYVVTKAIRPPKAIYTHEPDYPPGLKKSGAQGQVLMHIVVDERGAVLFPTVDVTPRPEFSEASIKAVEKWSFKPATLDGQPVAAVIIVTMEFKLY
ncbi:MAG TPA: energy transducer TonB [Terriglobales bacterium]|jgi:TonB family protein|nr:energy transducer TonB [Terriglobales bacterium]